MIESKTGLKLFLAMFSHYSHEVARIVIGLTKFASKNSLYFETGWETLANRRENRRLTTFYKIHNKLCPPYLFNCLPPVTSDVNSYNLRNNQNYVPPRCRLKNISKLVYSIYRFALERSRHINKKFTYIIFV